jgi:hypothetical protein
LYTFHEKKTHKEGHGICICKGYCSIMMIFP